MKFNLVLLALLPQALCAQQAVDPEELHLALQSKKLDAWVESIAAYHNVSKEAVRSNVQATIYHLEPASEDRAPGSAGGERARLERRQPIAIPYPKVYGHEDLNDPPTNERIKRFHKECRISNVSPENAPWKSSDTWSLWRAVGGRCEPPNKIMVTCRLPRAFAPRGWDENSRRNTIEEDMYCQDGEECAPFHAHNYQLQQPVQWADCIQKATTDHTVVIKHVLDYYATIPCPMQPESSNVWEMYGEAVDGLDVAWTVYPGGNDVLVTSHSPNFLFRQKVTWKGKDVADKPWLMFARMGKAATIRLYSHLTPYKV